MEIQHPVGAGRIGVEALVADLRAAGYNGTVTVECIDSLDEVDPDDADQQAVAMRETLETLL